MTPGSVRFLARRVYLGAVVVLASALRCGPSPRRVEVLREELGVSERTLVRWRRWWLRDFATSGYWLSRRALLSGDLDSTRLPAALLERFDRDEARRLGATLLFVSPIAGGKGLSAQAF